MTWGRWWRWPSRHCNLFVFALFYPWRAMSTVQVIFYTALWRAIATIILALQCLQFTDARQFPNSGHMALVPNQWFYLTRFWDN
jgi:hypothetical protein